MDRRGPTAAARHARRVPAREDVEFSNGDIHLSGTLVVPKGRGPFPAIVRIHGAGPADRVNSIDEYYAYHGIAFLSYDKRGVGRSSGDWRTAGVEELAGRRGRGRRVPVEAPRHRRQADRDRRRQRGWLGRRRGHGPRGAPRVPCSCSRARRSASATSCCTEAETGLRAQGVDGADLDQALAFQRWKIEFMRSGAFRTDAGWKELGARADSVRGEPWFNALAPWPARLLAVGEVRPHARLRSGAVLGALPRSGAGTLRRAGLKRARGAQRLRAAARLERGGNRKSTVEIVPDADHEGLDASKRDADFVQFVPGYLDRPLQWVLERVGGKRE